MTLADLRELYRAEGIRLKIEDEHGYAGRHVLEGGESLVLPLPGTTGFVRLFGQPHTPYHPKTQTVTRLTPRNDSRNAPPLEP